MTKKDIKEGDIVLLRDGRTCMVMPVINDTNNRLALYGKRMWIGETAISIIVSLEGYTDDLIDPDGLCCLDIIAVRKSFTFPISDPKVVFNILYSRCDPDNVYWDWKREEVKEVTMKEVEEKFGCKVKIVKEENEDG